MQVTGGAPRRIDRAKEVEMYIPFPRLAVLIEKVEYSSRPAFFIETATAIFMIRKPPREILTTVQCRFNQRPGAEREADTVKTIDVLNPPDHMPNAFLALRRRSNSNNASACLRQRVKRQTRTGSAV